MQAPVHNPINLHIGRRITLARAELGMSLETLAVTAGTTIARADQIERGASAGASELYLISVVLKKPVNYFFEGLFHPRH